VKIGLVHLEINDPELIIIMIIIYYEKST